MSDLFAHSKGVEIMSERKPQSIQAELVTRTRGEATSKELVFDPTTGQLVVKRLAELLPNPDAVVVDAIAEDGFFGWSWRPGSRAGNP
jgi:hypothetical protein